MLLIDLPYCQNKVERAISLKLLLQKFAPKRNSSLWSNFFLTVEVPYSALCEETLLSPRSVPVLNRFGYTYRHGCPFRGGFRNPNFAPMHVNNLITDGQS